MGRSTCVHDHYTNHKRLDFWNYRVRRGDLQASSSVFRRRCTNSRLRHWFWTDSSYVHNNCKVEYAVAHTSKKPKIARQLIFVLKKQFWRAEMYLNLDANFGKITVVLGHFGQCVTPNMWYDRPIWGWKVAQAAVWGVIGCRNGFSENFMYSRRWWKFCGAS